ncbi:MAG: vanadium-dependent haloperoxidase, partial [Pirellulaceae bacterium]
TYLSVPAAAPTASREAAIAEAATRVLSSLFPAQVANFQANRQEWLAKVPEGLDKQAGIAAGSRAADAMLAARSNDGSQSTVTYTPSGQPGKWEPTPPALAPALLPQWPGVRPFAISSGSAFRPGPSPALTSAQYAAAFDEVKLIGSATSSTRTPDQTQIANFWANGAGTATPPGHLNLIARTIAESRGTTLSENARLMAILNLALADAAIACWVSKYQFELWRPITGIRKAADDGNAIQPPGKTAPAARTFNVQGYGSNVDPTAPLILSDTPSMTSIQQPTYQPYYGPSFAAPPVSAAGIIGSCLQSMSGAIGGIAQMAALQAIVDEADEKVGFQPYPGVRSRRNPNYYASVVNGLNGQQAG